MIAFLNALSLFSPLPAPSDSPARLEIAKLQDGRVGREAMPGHAARAEMDDALFRILFLLDDHVERRLTPAEITYSLNRSPYYRHPQDQPVIHDAK
jgi:hypothetical protein